MTLKRSVFGIHYPGHKLALFISDVTFIAVAFYVASVHRLNTEPYFLSIEYIGINSIIITTLFIGGAYTSRAISNKPRLPLNTFFIVLSSVLPSLLFIYLLGPEKFTALLGRGIFPFAIIAFGIFAVLNRLVFNYLFHNTKHNRTILVLGAPESKTRIDNILDNIHITLDYSEKLIPQEFKKSDLNSIIISPEHKPDEQEQKTLIDYRLAGIPVFSLSDFFENYLFLVPVQEISNDWFIRAKGFSMMGNSIALRLKRISDILASLLLFIFTLPICLLTITLIKITSPGPIFFSQIRVGMNGKPFTVYKFRTMHLNAENSGAQWASENDPRIIIGGNFLRKTRIDEIPQCWNILKGEMSFIGPRPERPEFTSMLSEQIPYYDLRHIIKPGLTGWAQVKYPYGASTKDALRKLQYDLYYIKNYSLLLDLNIVLRTIKVTFLRGGR